LTLSFVRLRQRELAVRRALGASEGRLACQLLVLSMLLGILGVSAGLLTALPLLKLLLLLLPPEFPRAESIRLDAPLWLLSSLAAAAAIALFATATALSGRSPRPASTSMALEARSTPRSRSGALVAAEVAFALALGVVALLAIRSFNGLRHVDLGFSSEGVLVARVAVPDSSPPARQRELFDTLLERFRALPEVTAAGRISARPF